MTTTSPTSTISDTVHSHTNTVDITVSQQPRRAPRCAPARRRTRIARAGQVGLGVLIAGVAALHVAPAQATTGTLIGGTPITTRDLASTGTAGMIVHDRATGKPMLLTNYHVVSLRTGPFAFGAFVQDPGGYPESMSPATQNIANVTRGVYDGGAQDMAVATLAAGVNYYDTIYGLGVPAGVGEPRENSTVTMWDRIGKHALVRGTIATGDIHGNNILITPDPSSGGFAHEGDSGTVIVDDRNLVVGLLTGCSAVKCQATRMSTVLDSAHMDARILDPARQSIPLFRYYNPGINRHFYTTDWGLGDGKDGWIFEGQAGGVMRNRTCVGSTCTTPLLRYWNECNNDHFYTTSYGELGAGGGCWHKEGDEGQVFTRSVPGTAPLYRYYNTNTDEHFYTMYPGSIASDRAWSYEGAYYVYPTFGMSS